MMHQRTLVGATRRHAATARLARAAGVLLPSAAAVLGAALAPRTAHAHEIPERVAVVAYIRVAAAGADATASGPTASAPARAFADILVRVPLEALRDVDFPLRADGGLDLLAVRPLLPEAARVWLADYLGLEADGRALGAPEVRAARILLPGDRAFESWEGAWARLASPPLDSAPGLQWRSALVAVHLRVALPDAGAALVLRPRLGHLGVRTTSVLHVVAPDGADRVLVYEGNPERIALDPRWHDAVRHFVRSGFLHILGGIDHLLFVLCLVLPVRRWRGLVLMVTAFTVAHSLTLGAAALGYAPSAGWFPPLVETAIAASIVWLALENVLRPAAALDGRWGVAFAFGLVHGFGFSFALGTDLQFAGGHRALALAGFNVGVELGQLLVLAAAVPVLRALHARLGAARDRLVTVVGSVVLAHTAWHWMTDRGAQLLAHRAAFAWPGRDAASALTVVRLALVGCLALAVAWGFRQIVRALPAPDDSPTP